MESVIRFLARSLVAILPFLGPVQLRPTTVVPDYAEQLTLCVVVTPAMDGTHVELRWKVVQAHGAQWVYEPQISYSVLPPMAPGIQVWIPNLAPGVLFEIEARSVDIRTGRVSDWGRTSMWTLP